MLSDNSTPGKLGKCILPQYSRLLLGCALAALLLCTPIFVYTKYLKRMAKMAPDSKASASDANAPSKIAATGDLHKPVPSFQQQNAGTAVPTQQQLAGAAAHSAWTWNHRTGDTLASQKAGTNKGSSRQVSLSVPAQSKRTSQTFSRTWARNRVPRRMQTAWIAIWHESFEGSSKTKVMRRQKRLQSEEE